jgi:hypothetical protein
MNYRLALLPFLAVALQASTISLTGSLNPDDANDVLLYQFTTSTTSDLSFQSWGYDGGTNGAGHVISAGGFDPYLSIFLGSGPTATFFQSNDDGCFGCADPSLTLLGAAAGTYTIALTAFDNLSYAENLGAPFTLGDGFTGLGFYNERSSNFALDITSSAGFAQAPEPGTISLLAAGAALILISRRKTA